MSRREKDRKFGDPTNISKRGKARSTRKGRYDAGWTGSESRKRDQLMKQFTRLEGPSGNSEAYRNAECWCSTVGCPRLRAPGWQLCARCLEQIDVEVRAS